MVDKYPVITLCGSTRFKEQFLDAQKRLTLEGNIVISVGLSAMSKMMGQSKMHRIARLATRRISLANGLRSTSFSMNKDNFACHI